MSAAIDVVGAAKVELAQDLARDPKIVALTILCRSISNFRAEARIVDGPPNGSQEFGSILVAVDRHFKSASTKCR
jgi:hypothetical protein